MSTVTRPRGPLPARVYWTRRLLLLVLALGLVYGFAQLLGGRSGTPSAQPVGAAAGSSSSPSSSAATKVRPAQKVRPAVKAKHKRSRHPAPSPSPTPTVTPLAVPTGPCLPQDVRVDPKVVGRAVAGSRVRFALRLTTISSPACNWEVSPRSLVVKLTSGTDRIWSTQDCKAAVPREPVVVRKDHVSRIYVVWRGQRSDATCSDTTPWAQPGFYHVAAAALGAEPTDVQFELHKPQARTITPSPTPDPSPKKGKNGQPTKNG